MCGICGIISTGVVDEQVIKSMASVLHHRGPDDEGFYINNAETSNVSVGLGHKRLSIIDLESGRQPIHNEDKSLWIVYNGEIYNFRDLRKDLEARGHKFYTRTDTEVIIHLYEDYGPECLKYLRGMFAFALWDGNKKRLFLARDRLGQKPLVYTQANNKFIFASEIKSILKHPDIHREVDLNSLDLYLMYQYAPSPRTIFKDIKKLQPAHYLLYEKGQITIKRYWDLSFNSKLNIDKKTAQEETLRLLEESTKLRLVSDVPVGVFLSGGVDSSAVVAMMARLGVNPIKTFSIGFEDQRFNELKYARIVAQRFGTEHKEFIVKPETIKILPELIRHYNEPFADSSALPSYYVAKMTSEHVKVVLTGDAGDECFGGYDRYLGMKTGAGYDSLPQFVRTAVLKSAQGMQSIFKIRKLTRFLEGLAVSPQARYLKWISIFDRDRRNALYSKEFLNTVKTYDPSQYLFNLHQGIHEFLIPSPGQ